MSELDWDWPLICRILIHRLAPHGLVLSRADLSSLPPDLELKEYRHEDGSAIDYSWVTPEEARAAAPVILKATGERMGVTQMSGRWMKCGCVILWKLARDGIRLTPLDLHALPRDKTLYMAGYRDALDIRFMPLAESHRMKQWYAENDPTNIRAETA